MEPNVSVSKGVFVFKNNLQSLKQRRGKNVPTRNKNFNINSDERWFQAFTNLWKSIETKTTNLYDESFPFYTDKLLKFLSNNNFWINVSEIPAATLLTGINMPDHIAQFSMLIKIIKKQISPHVACLYSQDCHNIKHCIENMINQFINDTERHLESEFEVEEKHGIKKGQFNFTTLQAWYGKLYGIITEEKFTKHRLKYQPKPLVIIIPDLECFNEKVVQEFILITSAYLNILPFIFVFGITTSLSILHKMLPYHVSSKINIEYFNSQSSAEYLNSFLEDVLFSNDCPFHLGGDVFDFLMDVFLNYDLSATGFMKKCKYVMLEHFSNGNIMTLCTKKDTGDIIHKFDHENCEQIRHLPSFRNLVEAENYGNRIKLLLDDDYLKTILYQRINMMQEHLNMFHLFLKCLHVLVADLGQSPLGKQMSELYSTAVSTDITETKPYELCLQLLRFQSKEAFNKKLLNIVTIIDESEGDDLDDDLKKLEEYIDALGNPDVIISETEKLVEEMENVEISANRKQFNERLLRKTQSTKRVSKYEETRIESINFLNGLFKKYLYCPMKLYFHEIFFFNDISVKNQLVGSHRAAVHTGLNNPHQYLQCKCCKIRNDSHILRTMPDVCIAYKLHLEYGKMINLYDWLQGFMSILDPVRADEEEDKEIDPTVQARFTLAVAELEFLGFIKSSKRKTDHVQRLVWGG